MIPILPINLSYVYANPEKIKMPLQFCLPSYCLFRDFVINFAKETLWLEVNR